MIDLREYAGLNLNLLIFTICSIEITVTLKFATLLFKNELLYITENICNIKTDLTRVV